MFVEINPHNIDPRLIEDVVAVLRKGGLIVFPTDTVYAVGCDVCNKKGLAELAKWKQVKIQKAQFSMICKDLSQVSDYVRHLDRSTFRLLKQNLPGPFTFIMEATGEVSKLFDSSRKEIGIRIPDNPIATAITEALGNPMASTSLHDGENEIADYFADPYAIYERFDEEFGMIIDGGYGKLEASTIIDCTSGSPEILRQGIGKIDL